MKLKVATWNMAYWSHKNYLEEAWDYFLNLDVDIFLFQEAKRPNILKNDTNFIWHNAGESNGRREWGSGIYSKKYQLTEEPEESLFDWNRDRFKEFCVIANAKITEDIGLTVISLYGRFDKIADKPIKKDASSNLHKILSDLTGILNGYFGKRKIILGGDFNISTQFDKKWGGDSGKIFFDRLKDYNLENCYELNGNEDFMQTLRSPNSPVNWQNDYMFISKSISNNFKNCEVIDTEEVKKYSDHNPVIITLEI